MSWLLSFSDGAPGVRRSVAKAVYFTILRATVRVP